mmetsp:Transcript_342/g.1259  ORF Transcript_342/g.1259 Transcript_342/m.1259 type:complete len:220 (-) Transcript_342:2494-3153(-)
MHNMAFVSRTTVCTKSKSSCQNAHHILVPIQRSTVFFRESSGDPNSMRTESSNTLVMIASDWRNPLACTKILPQFQSEPQMHIYGILLKSKCTCQYSPSTKCFSLLLPASDCHAWHHDAQGDMLKRTSTSVRQNSGMPSRDAARSLFAVSLDQRSHCHTKRERLHKSQQKDHLHLCIVGQFSLYQCTIIQIHTASCESCNFLLSEAILESAVSCHICET